jgi:ribosomal protein S9
MRNTKFMNKIKKIFIFTVIASFAYNANAQIQVTSSMDATANIVAPILVSSTADMGFGKLSVTGVGSVIMSATDGGFTNDGAAQAIGTGVPGQVVISGESGEAYQFTVTQTTPLTTGSLGTSVSKMPMTDFTVTVAGGTEVSAATAVTATLASATETIKIGAKITTVAGQLTGAYAGAIAVVFEYQ